LTPRDVYLQPDAPDPVLDSELVLELVRRHVPSVREVTGVDESGGEARTYMCDDDLVLKVQRPHQLRPRTSLEKEAFILREIERDPSIRVPRVLGYGREGSIEYVVLSRIPGIALNDSALQGEARVEVLLALGATLRRIHDLDQTVMAHSALIPGDIVPSDLLMRLTETFEDLRESLDVEGRTMDGIDLDVVQQQCLSALPPDGPIATLHSNPSAEHCFVDPDAGAFSGLIDFGDAYRSHPALDVRSWRSPEDSRHMLTGYASAAPIPSGFSNVWRAGIIATELRLASRGYRTPHETVSIINQLLQEFE
jgi:aminoglycoside phosphotransferase (APT) family kinase protein